MIKKIFSNLYFAYSMVFGFTLLGIFAGYKLGYEKSLKQVDNKILEEVNKINSLVPVMVDSETQLDSVFLTSDSKTLIYRYSIVNYDREDLLEANAIPRLTQVTKRTSCQNSQMNFILSYGYNISLEYSDSEGAAVFTVNLTQADCDEMAKSAAKSAGDEKNSSSIFGDNIEDKIRESLKPEDTENHNQNPE